MDKIAHQARASTARPEGASLTTGDLAQELELLRRTSGSAPGAGVTRILIKLRKKRQEGRLRRQAETKMNVRLSGGGLRRNLRGRLAVPAGGLVDRGFQGLEKGNVCTDRTTYLRDFTSFDNLRLGHLGSPTPADTG
jgi:hypothetical protein